MQNSGELLSGRSEVRILSWTLDKKVDEAFHAPSAFLFEARRASKGSVSPAGSVGAPATPGRPQDDRALS